MNIRRFAVLLIGILGIGLVASGRAAACTPTGFLRDGIDMTAAVIATGDVTGQTIDATGCNVGIYYGPGTNGTVDNVEVFGANYFGILVTGDSNTAAAAATTVDISNSDIHAIGETPQNGTQHGVAIYYHACATGAGATGTISNNTISDYQKGGITVVCPGAGASVSGNTVTGSGPVDYIAQNGIEFGFGATGQITKNTVSSNQYTGSSTFSTGILIVGGSSWCEAFDICPSADTTGAQIVKNTVTNNDGGIVVQDVEGVDFEIPTTATNVKIINNAVSNDSCSNPVYQAGVADTGNNDKLIHNQISGTGYSTAACPIAFDIDDTFTTLQKVHANVVEP